MKISSFSADFQDWWKYRVHVYLSEFTVSFVGHSIAFDGKPSVIEIQGVWSNCFIAITPRFTLTQSTSTE